MDSLWDAMDGPWDAVAGPREGMKSVLRLYFFGPFTASHKLADSAWDKVDGPWDAVVEFPLNTEIPRFK